jgi:hypothetical protein
MTTVIDAPPVIDRTAAPSISSLFPCRQLLDRSLYR